MEENEKIEQLSLGQQIANWLNKADIINRAALVKKAKIDRGNFDKFLQKGEFPEKHANILKGILCWYGFIQVSKLPKIFDGPPVHWNSETLKGMNNLVLPKFNFEDSVPGLKAQSIQIGAAETGGIVFPIAAVKSFQEILTFAKTSNSRQEVELLIAANTKLTPNQIEMIRSKIKTS